MDHVRRAMEELKDLAGEQGGPAARALDHLEAALRGCPTLSFPFVCHSITRAGEGWDRVYLTGLTAPTEGSESQVRLDAPAGHGLRTGTTYLVTLTPLSSAQKPDGGWGLVD